MDREPGVMLWRAEAWSAAEESYDAWVAEYGDRCGVGSTQADALRSLANALERGDES